ncbi:MAG: PIN domain-containing protein [Pyrinomonadaceae bacterium]
MIEYLPDTNVFSRVFRGDLDATNFVENLEAVIDLIVYIECLQGSKSNQEKRTVKKVLDNFPLLPITSKISRRAVELIDTYSNSHGLLLADALIAATALENDLTILTYNVNDFRFIQDLKWEKPPV